MIAMTSLESNKLCFFFRLCIDTSIESTRTQTIDACAKLIGYMVQLHTDDALHIISNVLSVAVLVLAHACDNQTTQFNQKPFLKLFSSLFIELYNATANHSQLNHNFIVLYG